MDVPDPRSISSFEPAGFLFLLLRFLLFLRFCDLLFMIKKYHMYIILNLFNSLGHRFSLLSTLVANAYTQAERKDEKDSCSNCYHQPVVPLQNNCAMNNYS